VSTDLPPATALKGVPQPPLIAGTAHVRVSGDEAALSGSARAAAAFPYHGQYPLREILSVCRARTLRNGSELVFSVPVTLLAGTR
jgi:hypothetical protein